MRLHFLSGLPRSGSTLLAGLLWQNPRFSAAMTGPVGGLGWTGLSEGPGQGSRACGAGLPGARGM